MRKVRESMTETYKIMREKVILSAWRKRMRNGQAKILASLTFENRIKPKTEIQVSCSETDGNNNFFSPTIWLDSEIQWGFQEVRNGIGSKPDTFVAESSGGSCCQSILEQRWQRMRQGGKAGGTQHSEHCLVFSAGVLCNTTNIMTGFSSFTTCWFRLKCHWILEIMPHVFKWIALIICLLI